MNFKNSGILSINLKLFKNRFLEIALQYAPKYLSKLLRHPNFKKGTGDIIYK